MKKVFIVMLGFLFVFMVLDSGLQSQNRNGSANDTGRKTVDEDASDADDDSDIDAEADEDSGTSEGAPKEPAAAKEKEQLLHLTIGGKGYYNSGGSPTYTYYKPFAELELTTSYFFMKGAYYRYIGYQITDGSGNYEYIGFNQYGGELGLTPLKWLEISGSYLFSQGEFQYKAHEYAGELVLDFDIVTITGSYDHKLEEYYFSKVVGYTNTNTDIYNGVVAVNPNDQFSIEGSYQYSNAFFVQLDENYYKHMGRLGTTILPVKQFSITLGVDAGEDSARYRLYGGDIGFSLKFFGMLKFMAAYTYLWYEAPASTTSEIAKARSDRPKGHQGSSTTSGASLMSAAGSTGSNPYVRTSQIDLSYPTHAVVFGVTLRI